MIEQSSRGRNDQVDSLLQPVGLGLAVRSSHDDSERLRVVGHELLDDTEDLERKLSRGRDDDDTGTFKAVEEKGPMSVH